MHRLIRKKSAAYPRGANCGAQALPWHATARALLGEIAALLYTVKLSSIRDAPRDGPQSKPIAKIFTARPRSRGYSSVAESTEGASGFERQSGAEEEKQPSGHPIHSLN